MGYNMPIKKCIKCKIVKELNEFYNKNNICKSCLKEYKKKYYQLNKKHLDDLHKKYANENRSMVNEYCKKSLKISNKQQETRKRLEIKYKTEKRIQYLAKRKVEYALKSKKIIRGECNICKTDKNIHAHHNDYTKPLVIEWLCAKCHKQKHIRIKNGN